MLNLFQVRLRASDAPEGHVAEGKVRAEPEEVHPGEDTQVVVDLAFPEGGRPGAIAVKVSPPEDFATGDPVVEIRDDGATITIPTSTHEEVELGTYYLQVVYSDPDREHFEEEAPLEVKRHWVRIGDVTVSPVRATPGDPVDVRVSMGFEGTARVRGHVRGRLVPDDWDGEDDSAVKLPRERSSVSDTKEQVWHVRLPRNVPHGVYHADVEFSSGEGTARRRARGVLQLVPERGIEAREPVMEPQLLAPGDALTLQSRVVNTGREPLEARVGGQLDPEAGGASVPMEERTETLDPGEAKDVSWSMSAPDRAGRWLVRVRARADKAEGSDPPHAVLDVRPPNMVHVVGAVPSRPWASPGERVGVTLRIQDSGSRPGCEASVEVSLEGEAGETSTSTWQGTIGPEVSEATLTVDVPSPPDAAMDGTAEEDSGSNRFALVVREVGGGDLLRVPSAVAVRKRVRIVPRVVKASPDPTRLGDALLPGERVVKTLDADDLTVLELSSGCRMYARGDRVAGVEADVPMDSDFWDEALDADLRLYTDIKSGLEMGAKATSAEGMAVRAIADRLGSGKASATGLVKDTRELAKTFDPDRRSRGVSPRSGPLAPLASWLADPDATPEGGREIVMNLRSTLDTSMPSVEPAEASGIAAAAAVAAADHLDRLAELLTRAWEQDRLDAKGLRGATALVAAAGVALTEMHRHREVGDPWETQAQASEVEKVNLHALSAQLASLLELEVRHRVRKAAAVANTRQRAAHAAVARDLEVEVVEHTGHSGDATNIHVNLRNGSSVDLDLRLNVALPSGAWAVLEPQGRGNKLVSVGPVGVPARTEHSMDLVVYVPTTVKLDSYMLPLEVVPQPREVLPEQGGGGKCALPRGSPRR
ncbi:MAG: hypothetical protein JSW25_05485 [Thermoplasmata archaeon]|nr:MAG: hypothetical protein JSW25_05485 [Thermoplasmata archaeon]